MRFSHKKYFLDKILSILGRTLYLIVMADATPEHKFQACISHMMKTLGTIINEANMRGYQGVNADILTK